MKINDVWNQEAVYLNEQEYYQLINEIEPFTYDCNDIFKPVQSILEDRVKDDGTEIQKRIDFCSHCLKKVGEDEEKYELHMNTPYMRRKTSRNIRISEAYCPECNTENKKSANIYTNRLLYVSDLEENYTQELGTIYHMEEAEEDGFNLFRYQVNLIYNRSSCSFRREAKLVSLFPYRKGKVPEHVYVLKKNGKYGKTNNHRRFFSGLQVGGHGYRSNNCHIRNYHTESVQKCFQYMENKSSTLKNELQIRQLFDTAGSGRVKSYKIKDTISKNLTPDFGLWGYLMYLVYYYEKYPKTEQLIKAGMHATVNSLMRNGAAPDGVILQGESRKLKNQIGLNQPLFDLARKYQIDHYDVVELQKINKLDGNVSKECAEKYFDLLERSTTYSRTLQLTIDIMEFGESLEKITDYVNRVDMYQASPIIEALQYWRDYLQMAERLNLTVDRYPSSLIREHNLIARSYKMHLNEEQQKKFDQIASEMEKYTWDNGTYIIRVARTPNELEEEGRKLSHCVSSYAESVINGICRVFLLRSSKDPETPLYTVEMRNGDLVQAKGRFNTSLSDEAEAFLEKWNSKFFEKQVS